jgi:hypothetical protein
MLLTDTENTIQSIPKQNMESVFQHSNYFVEQQNNTLLWYEAVTRYGAIYVGLLRDQSTEEISNIYKNTILETIKILAREEGMIQLLENWLQEGLDLRPTQEINGDFYTFKLSDRNNVANNSINKIVVMLEYQALDNLPIPNWFEDMHLYLTSSDVFVDLILSNRTIDVAYQELLEENSILLIPESFSKSWFGYARSVDISNSILPINIGENLQTIGINNDMQISDSIDDIYNSGSEEYLNIRFNGVVKLPFHFLLGWTNTGSCVISKPLTYYPISVNRGNTCIATGELVSISSGFGIHINEVLL